MSEKNSPSGKFLNVETWDAMKACGFTEEELIADQPTGPIIFSYTRKQAIEDGVLVDLTRPGYRRVLAMEGCKLHTAMTGTAFAATVGSPNERSTHAELWDTLCRLGRVLRAMRVASLSLSERSDRVTFTAPGVDDKPVSMWALCGPGDDGEPVLTIMLEGED